MADKHGFERSKDYTGLCSGQTSGFSYSFVKRQESGKVQYWVKKQADGTYKAEKVVNNKESNYKRDWISTTLETGFKTAAAAKEFINGVIENKEPAADPVEEKSEKVTFKKNFPGYDVLLNGEKIGYVRKSSYDELWRAETNEGEEGDLFFTRIDAAEWIIKQDAPMDPVAPPKAVEKKNNDCGKCLGSGKYQNFGRCFRCGGTGKIHQATTKKTKYQIGDKIQHNSSKRIFEITGILPRSYKALTFAADGVTLISKTRLGKHIHNYPEGSKEAYTLLKEVT